MPLFPYYVPIFPYLFPIISDRKHQHMNHLVQHWWPVQPARFECFVKRSRGGNHGSPYGPYQFSYRIQIMETPKDPGLWQYAAELPLSSPGRAARTSFCPLSQQYCNETMFF